jgi:ketosteroid isomerase-like protein
MNSKNQTMESMMNILVLFMLFLSREVKAQTDNDIIEMDVLEAEIIKMDSLLFDISFNQCDAALFKKIIADDVEFFDDRYGLNTSKGNKIKSLLQKFGKSEKLTRKLNFCAIDKLGDFGAVQTGEHTFYINGKPKGTGKFIHIWERKDNNWKLKRIVSYEHRAIEK